MREIEVLVKCDSSKDDIKTKLSGYKLISDNHVVDSYYYDPLRDILKPDKELKLNECFRVRNKNNNYSLTYKVDHFDGNIWTYSDEYETTISDIDNMHIIIEKLGLKKLIEINNYKETYENDKYHIFLEDVKDLGIFLEVELIKDDLRDVNVLKEEIRDFIKSLDLNNVVESNEGKPEMMLKKIHFSN